MPSVIRRTIKGGAGFFAANIISKGLGFLFIVLTSRILGAVEFGILSLALSVTGIAQNFASFGLPNTIQRFLSGGGHDRSPWVFGSVLIVGATSAVLVSAALYFSAPQISVLVFQEPNLTSPLRILSVGVVLGVGASVLRAVLQAQEQIRQIIVVDTIRSAGKIVVVLLVFIWIRSATGAAVAVVAAFGVALVLAGEFVRSLEIGLSFDVEAGDIRRVLGYSAPLMVVGFSYFLAQQADRLMLGWLADAEVVGLYTVTSTLALVMSTLHAAFVSIFMPVVSKSYRNNLQHEMRDTYLFISRWVGAANGAAFIGFAGAGLWILQIFGSEYSSIGTYHVLLLLSALYFVGTWVGPTGALLQMTDGHRLELMNTIAFVLVNVVLNYILIQRFGIQGAAAATLISGVLRNGLQVLEIAWRHGFSPFVINNALVLVYTVSAASAIVAIGPGIVGSALAGVSVILLVGFMLGTATDEERISIRQLASRILCVKE